MNVRIASDGDGGIEPRCPYCNGLMVKVDGGLALRCVLCKRVLISASNATWRKKP